MSPKVYHFKGPAADYQNHPGDSPFLWPLIQAVRYVEVPPYSVGVSPEEVYFFTAWPGKECETADIGLARYPKTAKLKGEKIPLNLPEWSWYSFCKTHYANNVSTEHFLKCHFSVCALLKHAEKLSLLAWVKDEGEFWDRWDFAALAEEVARWDRAIRECVRELKDAFGENNVLSPIEE